MNLREQYEKDYITVLWAALESKPVHDIGYSSPESEWMPVNKERLTAAVAALPQLQAESRSSWVSVKERLPEDSLSVLIFYDGHMSIGSYLNDKRFPNEWFGIGCTLPINVTHWMKPEPPKGE